MEKVEIKEKKPYTIYGGEIDNKIEKKLHIFLKTIKTTSLNKYIKSIILTGSYARGEGTVQLRNNKPIDSDSDFDTYIITNREIGYSFYSCFFREISEKAKFTQCNFMVEFHFSNNCNLLNTSKLPKLLPIFRFFNIKYYSRLIYGEDVRKLIPNFAPSDLPVYEGLRLMLNRLFEIADSFNSSLLTNKSIPLADKLKLSKEACKSYIFALDAFTILIGKFSYDYKSNLKKIGASKLHTYLFKRIPKYKTKISSSIQQLKTSKFKLDNCQKRWKESLSDLLVMINIYLKIAFGIEENDIPLVKLHKISKQHLRPYLKLKLHSMHINLNENSTLIYMGCKIYQILENIKFYFANPKDQLPYHNKITIDPGLKIYLMGLISFRKLLNSTPYEANKAISNFDEVYKHHFKRKSNRREVIFGSQKKKPIIE